MRTLNLGVLAHVDAGKTSLTERLLYDAGAIGALGAVDDGTTQTDAMRLERSRGITIRSSVATFAIGETWVHLIDTPGHTDFVAEVERALDVLDGAVLVLSAVEGVQAQTRVLMRTLTAMSVPTLLFVNKIDRAGARGLDLLDDVRGTLSTGAIAMNVPSLLGTPAAAVTARDRTVGFVDELAALLAEHSDAILESYLDVTTPDADPALLRGLYDELTVQVRAGLVHPVFFGSAMTAAGVRELCRGATELLATDADPDDGELDGVVFAMERDITGRTRAVARLFSGALAVRDTVPFSRCDASGALVHDTGRVTDVRTVDGSLGPVGAGGIARIAGLRGLRVGDHLGSDPVRPRRARFRPPTLEVLVSARRAEDAPGLFVALEELAEEDPLIDVRRTADHGHFAVSLYGEVQREVIAARLADEHGVEARFSTPRVVYVERPAGTGAAVERMGEAETTYFYATVGLRVEPGAVGTGVRFRLAAERGSLPAAFLTAIEETVRATLREGLYGWRVVDCVVTLTDTGYAGPISAAGDFRKLTPLVLMAALRRAGTVVHEPVERVELEIPADTVGAVVGLLARCGGAPEVPEIRGESCRLEAVMPTSRLRELDQRLPDATGGRALSTSRFEGYRRLSGRWPTRARTDHNPANRDEYLLRVFGRV